MPLKHSTLKKSQLACEYLGRDFFLGMSSRHSFDCSLQLSYNRKTKEVKKMSSFSDRIKKQQQIAGDGWGRIFFLRR